jgi:hypothetical protein
LLIEHHCEPTQSLCPCDHALIYASSYFPKPLPWQPLLVQIILFVQNKRQDLFLGQVFIKTKYLQN